MTVGLVLVSHSAALADGTAALAAQMAPSVVIVAAGGGDDGGIGTSFDRITAALEQIDTPDGAVILYDLGSALLTAETALEFLEPEMAQRFRVVDGPLVEGSIAAAVTAEGGGDLDAVAGAVLAAADGWSRSVGAPADGSPCNSAPADGAPANGAPAAGDGVEDDIPTGPAEIADVEIVNPLGLHARPAAEMARALAGTSATVRIGRPDGPGVDLRSVLGVVGLAVRGGDTVRIRVWGPDAARVLPRLRQLIRGGFGEAGHRPAPVQRRGETRRTVSVQDGTVAATPGATGGAVGPLRRLGALPDTLPAGADPAPEGGRDRQVDQHRLDTAISAAAEHLAGQGEFGQAHAALVADPELRRQVTRVLDGGAAAAWWDTVVRVSRDLESSADELVASRGVDLREAGVAVLAELGVRLDRIGPSVAGTVVVATDLGPAEVPALVEFGAVAAVLGAGSVTAHAVIVARGLGLPLVLGTGTALDGVAEGTLLLIDGDTGRIRVDPPAEETESARAAISRQQSDAQQLRDAARHPVVLPDGRQIMVAANVGSVADAVAAVANGADGVGLLRTELLVLDRPTFPDEDTQTADLVAILEVLGDRPVVIRALDVGGDKPLATLDVDERRNGFLGVRGLRFLLEHPDLLRTQLRAIFRAALGHRISVMAPMVTVRSEAQAWRRAVEEALDSLAADGIPCGRPEEIGIMVEVPAAALAADQFAGVVDFFSVGSNDLTSYTMAADRTEPGVSELLDPGAPPVQRLLDLLFAAAEVAGIPVAVCGEMAGMPQHAPGLVRRGVSELSMAPARIPQIKALLRDRPELAARDGLRDRA